MPQVIVKSEQYELLDQIQVELRTKGKKVTYGDIIEVVFTQVDKPRIIDTLLNAK